ncbi:MAG: acyltransferase [Alphaproteobacteria bacterium]|nr:acyltransferase [Alphaproteobacteria bacterium]
MGTHSSTSKPATIAALAGARAVPPLLIVLYHFSEGHHYSGLRLLDLVATRGYLWVEFFFTLSGFILTHVYAARLRELWTRKGYFGFLKARLIRLYPLHLFMLLVLLALVVSARLAGHLGGYASIYDRVYHPMVDAKGFVLSLFLVQGWNTLNYLTWNGVAWFVSVEFALCLVFPLFLKAQHGRPWRGAALVAAGIAGLMLLLANSSHGLDLTFHNGVLRGLCDFSIGVGLAVLFRHAGAIAALPASAHGAAQALLLVLLAYVFTGIGWSHTGNDLYIALTMQAFVFILAFDKGWLADLLKLRGPQLLGDWSYAIYLGQTFWLQYMRVLEFRFYPPRDAMVLGQRFSTLMWWLEPTLLVLACALWGGALAEWVEKPAAKWLRARLDQPRRAAPASGIT